MSGLGHSEAKGQVLETVLGPIKVIPECKGQAVCTNGLRCWEAGECLKPYQCKCGRSSDRLGTCRRCEKEAEHAG